MSERSILIVEDDLLVARSIEVNLKRLGYAVLPPVDSAAAALAAIATAPPDLILMDIRLQGAVDGIEIAQQIRAVANIPIIYTTAYADEQVIGRAKVTEPYGYLVKPFGIRELSSIIEIAFYKHQMERQLTHLNQVLRAVRSVNQLIAQERDPEQLLAGACDCLVETRGYRGAWIVRIDAAGDVLQAHQSGMSGAFAEFVEALRQGYRPPCWEPALAAPEGDVVVELGAGDCLDCGFPPQGEEKGRLLARLEHAGVVYGLLAVVLPLALLQNEEERSLFKELANDIAFALHTIEGDIQRKRAEEALRESEERYRQFIETSRSAIYMLHPETKAVLDANHAFLDLLGYRADEVQDLTLFDIVAHERAEVERLFERILREESVLLGERLWWRKDKTLVDVLVIANLVRQKGGASVFVQGYDLSARKQAEDALRESEERYHAFIESTADMVFVKDEGARYLVANRSLVNFLGKPRAEIIGRTDFDLLPADAAEACRISDQQALEERAVVISEERAGGRFLETAKFPVSLQQGKIGVGGIIRDITERKQAEEALLQSKALLDVAGRMARFGGWRVELAANRVIWSDQVAAIHETPLGYAPSVEQGINFYAPAWQGKIAQVFGDCVREGRPYDEEMEIITARGNRVWVRTTGEAMYDESGIIVGVEGTFQDITERKQAETTLQASEMRYRRLFESAKDGILILDADTGQIVDVNPFLVDLLGYSHAEFLGKKLWEIGVFKDILASKSAFAELQNQGYVRYEDLPLETVAGRVIYVEFVSNSYFVGQAKVVQCNIRDITARKQAEDALRESQRQLATLMGNLPGIAYRCKNDSDWTMEFMSDGCYALTGYQPADMIGNARLPYAQIVHPEDGPRIWDEVQTALERKQPYQLSFRILTAAGEEKWVWEQGQSVGVDRGGTLILEGFITDITARKQAEDALTRERILLRTVIDNLPDAVYAKDLEARKLLVNRADLRNMGLDDQADVLGKTDFELFPRDVAEHFDMDDRTVLDAGTPVLDREERLVRPDGEEFWLLTSKVPLRDAQGQVTGLVGIGRDITERKQAQEILRASHQNLAVALCDLQDAQERLVQQERLAAIGQLAAGVAHDFNNVLGAIQLYTEVALQVPDLPRAVAQALKTTVQQSRRGTDLVQQILDFARRSPLKRQAVALQPLLSEITALLKNTLPENIRVTLEVSPEEHFIDADPTRVQQALLNLALNARDAMPGGGRLRLELDKLRPEAGRAMPLPELEGRVWERIRVSDSGIGIEPELLSRIFEPFFTTKAAFGTGLGLSQVEGIVAQHGGRVTVASQVGQGTTFTLYWPALEAPAPEPETEEASPILTGQGELILVVEDDLAMRTALAACLEMLDYQVLEAPDGEAALALFADRADDIALVISDWMMPGMNGVELVRELQRLRPTVKCLLLTGYFPSDIGQGNVGIEWVLKPPTVEGLAAAITRVLHPPGD